MVRKTQNYKDNLEVLLSAIYHKILKKGDAVIDGGANGGLHSISLARLVGPTGFVYAYEPQVSCLESIRNYARSEQVDSRIVFRQAALGQKAGVRTFCQHRENNALSSAKIMQGDDSQWNPVTVEFVELDREPIRGRCSFIKLDLEGGERDAIFGAKQLIKRDHPVIAFESAFRWAAFQFRYDVSEFLDFFLRNGYVIRDFSGQVVAPHNFHEDFLVHELIAYREESQHAKTINNLIDEFNSRFTAVAPAGDWAEITYRVQQPFDSGFWGPVE